MFSFRRRLALSLLPILAMACARSSGGAGSDGAPELLNTYWKLTELAGKPVTVADNQREAYIQLRPDSKQVSGSGGCNRLFGSYEVTGTALTFGGVGSTKMACATGMDTETAFLPVLGRVARWRINGRQLEVSDSGGAVLARFEAQAMK